MRSSPSVEHGAQELVDGVGTEIAVAQAHAVGGDEVDEHLALAVAHAAGLDDGDGQAAARQVLPGLGDHGQGAVGAPAGAGADVQHHAVAAAQGADAPRGALLTAGFALVTHGAVVDALEQVRARRGRRVPALVAARRYELAVVHGGLVSLSQVTHVVSFRAGALGGLVRPPLRRPPRPRPAGRRASPRSDGRRTRRPA